MLHSVKVGLLDLKVWGVYKHVYRHYICKFTYRFYKFTCIIQIRS